MQIDNTADTILIQITNSKALKLILDLEELSLIRVLERNVQPAKKLSEKYAGKLSPVVGEQLQQHIEQSRNEWERDI
jgi:hypothetical protein